MIRSLLCLALCLLCVPAFAEPLTRSEALKIAEAFCNCRWEASGRNVLHGRDLDGVIVNTPNRNEPSDAPDPNLWLSGTFNIGVPYKWGGFDTIDSFKAGIKKGKAAGDIYSPDKRRMGGSAVSSNAVGIDCSGFISRCWKLREKQSTNSLPSICVSLRSPEELRAGDIMNAPGGHVILFARWEDEARTRGQFYEASPYCKVISSSYEIASLTQSGFRPMRYKLIRE